MMPIMPQQFIPRPRGMSTMMKLFIILIVIIIIIFVMIGISGTTAKKATNDTKDTTTEDIDTEDEDTEDVDIEDIDTEDVDTEDDPTATDIGEDKYKEIWKYVGCTTDNHPSGYVDWHKTKTKSQLIQDSSLWASMTDEEHRKGCYGDDETKWPGQEGFENTKNTPAPNDKDFDITTNNFDTY
jgi:hypothetical protein